jgi:hypothetical protein
VVRQFRRKRWTFNDKSRQADVGITSVLRRYRIGAVRAVKQAFVHISSSGVMKAG